MSSMDDVDALEPDDGISEPGDGDLEWYPEYRLESYGMDEGYCVMYDPEAPEDAGATSRRKIKTLS